MSIASNRGDVVELAVKQWALGGWILFACGRSNLEDEASSAVAAAGSRISSSHTTAQVPFGGSSFTSNRSLSFGASPATSSSNTQRAPDPLGGSQAFGAAPATSSSNTQRAADPQGGMTSATGGAAAGGVVALGGINSAGQPTPMGAASGATAPNPTPDCDVVVNPPVTIQSSIDASSSPGTVCIGPGLYREDLALRDGVDLRGSGTNTRICGTIVADAATETGVSLSQLAVHSRLSATGSIRLTLTDMDFTPPSTTDCATALDRAIELTREGGAGIRFSATRVKVGPWGFTLTLGSSDEPVNDEIRIAQSRCTDPYQCWNFVDLNLGSTRAPRLAATSRLQVEIVNNLVPNVVLEGMVFEGESRLLPEDAMQSLILLRHNTVISKGDPNHGIDFWGSVGVPVTLANNVVAYINCPLCNADQPNFRLIGNATSTSPESKAWFEDFGGGNFTPSPASPLLGTANVGFAVPVDIDGRPRLGRYDVGAFQRP